MEWFLAIAVKIILSLDFRIILQLSSYVTAKTLTYMKLQNAEFKLKI